MHHGMPEPLCSGNPPEALAVQIALFGHQGAPLFSFCGWSFPSRPLLLRFLSENVVPCQNHLKNSNNQMTPCAALAKNAAGRAAMRLLPSGVRSRLSNIGKTAGGAGRRQNGAPDSAKYTSVLPRNSVWSEGLQERPPSVLCQRPLFPLGRAPCLHLKI